MEVAWWQPMRILPFRWPCPKAGWPHGIQRDWTNTLYVTSSGEEEKPESFSEGANAVIRNLRQNLPEVQELRGLSGGVFFKNLGQSGALRCLNTECRTNAMFNHLSAHRNGVSTNWNSYFEVEKASHPSFTSNMRHAPSRCCWNNCCYFFPLLFFSVAV